MAQDERDDRLIPSPTTSVAVPAQDVLLSVDLQPRGPERPAKVFFSFVFIVLSVWFVVQASKVDTDPDALMPGLFIQLALSAALSAAAAVAGLRSALQTPKLEVTPTLVRVPGPLQLSSTTVDRAELTEANITTIRGERSLVLATNRQRVVLAQRDFLPDAWDRLMVILDPTGR